MFRLPENAGAASDPTPKERARYQSALMREALRLGTRIAEGDEAGITQQETTISETVLLNLHQRLGPRGLRIETLTQPDEGKRGADWIWCVGDDHGWFSFYIQAKKLKASSYDLGYQDSQERRQIDKLIAAATAARVAPAYVLYNPVRAGRSYSYVSCVRSVVPGADAFTAVGAHAARALLDIQKGPSVHLDWVKWVAHPWSCLAGCPDGHSRLQRPYFPQTPWWSTGDQFVFPWHEAALEQVREDRFASRWGPPGIVGAIARLIAEQADHARLVSARSDGGDDEGIARSIDIREQLSAAFTSTEPMWVSRPSAALDRWREQTAVYGLEPAAVVSLRLDGATMSG